MFNVDFDKLVLQNTPKDWVTDWWKNWFKALLKPIKTLYTDYLLWRENNLIELHQNSQVIYLEKLLNDKFNSVAKPGPQIYIEHLYTEVVLLYNRAEIENATPPPAYEKEPMWMYGRYNIASAYAEGEYAVEGNIVYMALEANTGFVPSETPDKWTAVDTVDFILNRSEVIYSNNFFVCVPGTITFDEAQMKALINKYKLFDKDYRIQTY